MKTFLILNLSTAVRYPVYSFQPKEDDDLLWVLNSFWCLCLQAIPCRHLCFALNLMASWKLNALLRRSACWYFCLLENLQYNLRHINWSIWIIKSYSHIFFNRIRIMYFFVIWFRRSRKSFQRSLCNWVIYLCSLCCLFWYRWTRDWFAS